MSSIAQVEVDDKTIVSRSETILRVMETLIVGDTIRSHLEYSVPMILRAAVLVCLAAACLPAEGFDPRLPVSTLVREDLFAGFLTKDMTRLAAGEKTLEALLRERPQAKPSILAWQAGVALHRAVWAHEAKQTQEFDGHYKRALSLFAEAAAVASATDIGPAAITGGTYSLLMDRLPEKHRPEAAAKAYEAYHRLLDVQAPMAMKMPLHIRGELFAGLALTAQRTGRSQEASQHLDQLIETLPNTPYAARAKKWKENPKLAATTSITCLTCHDSGKLEARRHALNSQPPISK